MQDKKINKDLVIKKTSFKFEDLLEEFEEVPMGNSDYQDDHFTPGQESDSRRYRQCLLVLKECADNLHFARCSKIKHDIDLEEIDYKTNLLLDKSDKTPEDGFQLRRYKVEREEKEYQFLTSVQLINDLVHRAEKWYKRKLELPKFTREEFEKEERASYKKRLLSDASDDFKTSIGVSKGVVKSLREIGIDLTKDKKGNLAYLDPEEAQKIIEDKKNKLDLLGDA